MLSIMIRSNNDWYKKHKLFATTLKDDVLCMKMLAGVPNSTHRYTILYPQKRINMSMKYMLRLNI